MCGNSWAAHLEHCSISTWTNWLNLESRLTSRMLKPYQHRLEVRPQSLTKSKRSRLSGQKLILLWRTTEIPRTDSSSPRSMTWSRNWKTIRCLCRLWWVRSTSSRSETLSKNGRRGLATSQMSSTSGLSSRGLGCTSRTSLTLRISKSNCLLNLNNSCKSTSSGKITCREPRRTHL